MFSLSIPYLVETKSEDGELLSVNQFCTFIKGAGGFGGKRTSEHAKVLYMSNTCTCFYYAVEVSVSCTVYTT